MEFIFEIIIEVIFVWILSYPGAFIRWGITGFKKGKFKVYAEKDGYVNFFVLSIFILFIVLIVKLV